MGLINFASPFLVEQEGVAYYFLARVILGFAWVRMSLNTSAMAKTFAFRHCVVLWSIANIAFTQLLGYSKGVRPVNLPGRLWSRIGQ